MDRVAPATEHHSGVPPSFTKLSVWTEEGCAASVLWKANQGSGMKWAHVSTHHNRARTKESHRGLCQTVLCSVNRRLKRGLSALRP